MIYLASIIFLSSLDRNDVHQNIKDLVVKSWNLDVDELYLENYHFRSERARNNICVKC